MRYLFLLFACLTICQVNAQQFDSGDTSRNYFPSKTISNFQNSWYSGQLAALQEPIIFNDKSGTEIYRFTWLRTFHNPVAIRIEKKNNQYLLTWKVCSGAGGYSPGKLKTSEQKVIQKGDWDVFKSKLKNIDFWNFDTTPKPIVNADGSIQMNIGNDGSQWILEGKTAEQYHVVDRWTPNANTAYYACCDYLIWLTGLKIVGDAKY